MCVSTWRLHETCSLDGYSLVLAPMTYMLRDGFAERVQEFVHKGGTFVSTYWSGVVNETALCFLGGFPGPLKDVMGLWEEEIDSLGDDHTVPVKIVDKGLEAVFPEAQYTARQLCAIVHPQEDTPLAVCTGRHTDLSHMPVGGSTGIRARHYTSAQPSSLPYRTTS